MTFGRVIRPQLSKQTAYSQSRLKPSQLFKQAVYIKARIELL